MSDDLMGLDFRAAIRDVKKGLLVNPILHNYLFDAKFPRFDINFPGWEMDRKPDGWFHPSTHPMWSAAALYHYLANPHLMVAEKKNYMGTLSITVGTAMHGFMQMCMNDAGILPHELQVCTVCDKQPGEKPCDEPGVIDVEAGERGHMDGVLDLSMLSTPSHIYDSPLWEFKTTNPTTLRNVVDLDLDIYRKKWPEYYAQNQSYMRMSGRRMMIVTIMAMGYPWEMREIHVPYDPAFAQGIRSKYLAVRQAVADQQPPRECCAKFSACSAGAICASGLGRTTSKPGRAL